MRVLYSLVTFLAVVHNGLLAQSWQPEINLMPNDYGSSWTTGNNAHSLAVKGDTVFLAWYNATDTNYNTGHQVHFKMFDGNSWSTTKKISQGTNWRRHSWYPSCAVNPAGDLYVVWESNDNGISIYDVVFRQLSNGVWSGTNQVTNNAVQGYSWHPSIGCGADGSVHFVWQDNRQGTFRVFYIKLTGGSWGSPVCLSPSGVYSGMPSLSILGSNPAVVWQDFREGCSQIYFTRQAADSWTGDSAVSHSSAGAYAPSMAADRSGNIHVAWEDLRDGNFEIYYRKLNVQTGTWEAEQRVTSDPFYSRQPVLACSGDSLVYLFWADDRQGSYEIYSRKMLNNSWQPETTLTAFDRRNSMSPSAAVDMAGNVHLTWSDNREWYAVTDIFYKLGSVSKSASIGGSSSQPGIAWLAPSPNPARGNTVLSFNLSKPQRARIRVFNITGQLVRDLYDGEAGRGKLSLRWDGCDQAGLRVVSGVYLVNLQTDNETITGKVMVLR